MTDLEFGTSTVEKRLPVQLLQALSTLMTICRELLKKKNLLITEKCVILMIVSAE